VSYKWESIPGDVMAAAQAACDLAGAANLDAESHAVLAAVKAILAERKRCAEVARRYTSYDASHIVKAIEASA
jgi:hypothetical protein